MRIFASIKMDDGAKAKSEIGTRRDEALVTRGKERGKFQFHVESHPAVVCSGSGGGGWMLVVVITA